MSLYSECLLFPEPVRFSSSNEGANTDPDASSCRASAAGFSLLELLTVMVIISILFGLGIPAFQKMLDSQLPRTAANEFASALRSARQYAMDNNTRTRVVFASDELIASASGKNLVTGSYGSYALFIPTQPSGASGYTPLRLNKKVMDDFMQTPWLSIPSGFVGQWIPLPLSEGWRAPRTKVAVESDLFSPALPTEADLNKEFYVPPKYWDSAGTDFYANNVMFATYPRNYFQTPYPISYRRITTKILPTEPVYDLAGSGATITYKDYWPAPAPYTFFTGIPEHAGDYKKLGAIEGSTTSDRRFYNLHGIEFDSKGLPTFTGTANLVVVNFLERKNRKNALTVTVDKATGIPAVK